jgi:hypothetical protein
MASCVVGVAVIPACLNSSSCEMFYSSQHGVSRGEEWGGRGTDSSCCSESNLVEFGLERVELGGCLGWHRYGSRLSWWATKGGVLNAGERERTSHIFDPQSFAINHTTARTCNDDVRRWKDAYDDGSTGQ